MPVVKLVPFKPGASVGGVEVLALAEGGVRKRDTSYRVRYDCCSRETTMTHNCIIVRKSNGSTLCKSCKATLQAQKRAERRERDEHLVLRGCFDLNGEWWPSLS